MMTLATDFFQPTPKLLDRRPGQFAPGSDPGSRDAFSEKLNECCDIRKREGRPADSMEDLRRKDLRGKEGPSGNAEHDDRASHEFSGIDDSRQPDRLEAPKEPGVGASETGAPGVESVQDPASGNGTDGAMHISMSAFPIPFTIRMLTQAMIGEAAQGSGNPASASGLGAGQAGDPKSLLVGGSPTNENAAATTGPGRDGSPLGGESKQSGRNPQLVALSGNPSSEAKISSSLPRDLPGAEKNAAPVEAGSKSLQKIASNLDSAAKSQQDAVLQRAQKDLPSSQRTGDSGLATSSESKSVAARVAPSPLPPVAAAGVNSQSPLPIAITTAADGELARASATAFGPSSGGGEGEKQRGDSNQSSQLGGSSVTTSSASAEQKSESIRIFINRIDSALQQMRQENTSQVQIKVQLDRGEIIRISLSLRGAKLKTVVRSESETVRNVLRASWMEVSKVLAEQGVDAENLEFESGAGEGSSQQGRFGEESDANRAMFALSPNQGPAETSAPVSASAETTTTNESPFFSRIA